MSKQKSGLIVFTIGFILSIVCSVFQGLETMNAVLANIGTYGSLVTFILEIVGLGMASGSNKSFKNALIGIFVQVILTIAMVVVVIIAASGNTVNTTLVNVASWIAIVIDAADIYVMCSVVEGCGEASEKVKGMSKVIIAIVCVAIIAVAVCKIVSLYNTEVAGVFAIVALVASLVYQVLMVIILLRTIPKIQ